MTCNHMQLLRDLILRANDKLAELDSKKRKAREENNERMATYYAGGQDALHDFVDAFARSRSELPELDEVTKWA